MDTKTGKAATSDLATRSDDVAPRRRYYREAQKRQIVEESMIAGASVAQVALRHGINANLLFTWRKQMQRDASESATLLPVQVADVPAPVKLAEKAVPESAASPALGCIEIELASGHRVRVHGAADSRTVRSIIEALSR